MANRKPLILEETPDGCIVPTSHKLNPDGYFRKYVEGRLQMYHRYVWEQSNGEVPDGYEIDHKCKNRACCNIEHLQMLDRTTHLTKTNRERYKSRFDAAKSYWESAGCTGTELGKVFGVTPSCACRWIRIWKQQGAETISKESTGYTE